MLNSKLLFNHKVYYHFPVNQNDRYCPSLNRIAHGFL